MYWSLGCVDLRVLAPGVSGPSCIGPWGGWTYACDGVVCAVFSQCIMYVRTSLKFSLHWNADQYYILWDLSSVAEQLHYTMTSIDPLY